MGGSRNFKVGHLPIPWLRVTATTTSTISLSWGLGRNYSRFSSYSLEFSTDNENWTPEYSGTNTTYVDTNLPAETTHYYRIRMQDTRGNYSEYRTVNAQTAAVGQNPDVTPIIETDFEWYGYGQTLPPDTQSKQQIRINAAGDFTAPYSPVWDFYTEGTGTAEPQIVAVVAPGSSSTRSYRSNLLSIGDKRCEARITGFEWNKSPSTNYPLAPPPGFAYPFDHWIGYRYRIGTKSTPPQPTDTPYPLHPDASIVIFQSHRHTDQPGQSPCWGLRLRGNGTSGNYRLTVEANSGTAYGPPAQNPGDNGVWDGESYEQDIGNWVRIIIHARYSIPRIQSTDPVAPRAGFVRVYMRRDAGAFSESDLLVETPGVRYTVGDLTTEFHYYQTGMYSGTYSTGVDGVMQPGGWTFTDNLRIFRNLNDVSGFVAADPDSWSNS